MIDKYIDLYLQYRLIDLLEKCFEHIFKKRSDCAMLLLEKAIAEFNETSKLPSLKEIKKLVGSCDPSFLDTSIDKLNKEGKSLSFEKVKEIFSGVVFDSPASLSP